MNFKRLILKKLYLYLETRCTAITNLLTWQQIQISQEFENYCLDITYLHQKSL